MPTRIPGGGNYNLEITAKRIAWLIVLYQEADGRAGLLLPTMRLPRHVVSENEALRMPAMEVSLRDPKVAVLDGRALLRWRHPCTFAPCSQELLQRGHRDSQAGRTTVGGPSTRGVRARAEVQACGGDADLDTR